LSEWANIRSNELGIRVLLVGILTFGIGIDTGDDRNAGSLKSVSESANATKEIDRRDIHGAHSKSPLIKVDTIEHPYRRRNITKLTVSRHGSIGEH